MSRLIICGSSRLNPLLIQVIVVLGGSLATGAIAFSVLARLSDSGNASVDHSRAALLTADIERTVAEIDRQQILPSRDAPASAAVGTTPARTIPRSILAASAVQAAELLGEIRRNATDLHQLVGSRESLELLGAALEAPADLARFLRTSNATDLETLEQRMDALRIDARALRPKLGVASDRDSASIISLAEGARTAIIATTILIAATAGLTTWLFGRRLTAALRLAQAEQTRLEVTKETLERRNAQFQALYQVVTEVSENLSLKYVVNTAVHQARRLVAADEVSLRLLRGQDLVIFGTSSEDDVVRHAAVQLGTGAVGRAARRGKSVRVTQDETHSVGGDAPCDVHSGVIVPLIVGARVVGTIECWAARPAAFNDDDERMLELLASQVATAVVAADTHEASERDAHHDPLTGLPNRRQLTKDIRDRFTPALLRGESVSVAMLDIDHFKRFNDEFGHRVGDITLQQVAEVMRTSVRDHDRVYRYGGEEFAVIAANSSEEDVERLIDRVRIAVARTPLTGEDLQPVGPVTVSAGVAHGPLHGGDPEDLLEYADRALYQSKWAGRNRVTIYQPGAFDDDRPSEPPVALALRAQRSPYPADRASA